MFNTFRTPILRLIEDMNGFSVGTPATVKRSWAAAVPADSPWRTRSPSSARSPSRRRSARLGNRDLPVIRGCPSRPVPTPSCGSPGLAAQVSTLTLGGVSSDQPEIAEMTRPSRRHPDSLEGRARIYLHRLCPLHMRSRCSRCPWTGFGNKRLREESISEDVHPISIDPVGQYTIRFRWSDGVRPDLHVELLRELSPAPSAQKKASARRDKSPAKRRCASGLPRRRGRVPWTRDPASRPCSRSARCREHHFRRVHVGRERSSSRSRGRTGPPLRSGEDPTAELGRAAGARGSTSPMEVDVDPAREFPRRLLVVPCPPKRRAAPSDRLALLAVELVSVIAVGRPPARADRARDLDPLLARVARLSRADVAGLGAAVQPSPCPCFFVHVRSARYAAPLRRRRVAERSRRSRARAAHQGPNPADLRRRRERLRPVTSRSRAARIQEPRSSVLPDEAGVAARAAGVKASAVSSLTPRRRERQPPAPRAPEAARYTSERGRGKPGRDPAPWRSASGAWAEQTRRRRPARGRATPASAHPSSDRGNSTVREVKVVAAARAASVGEEASSPSTSSFAWSESHSCTTRRRSGPRSRSPRP